MLNLVNLSKDRIGLAILVLFFALIFFAPPSQAGGRLRIFVEGGKHQIRQPITIRLRNDADRPLVLCTTFFGGIVDATVDPIVPDFEVHVRRKGRWGGLIWGSDMGEAFRPWILSAREATEFKIILSQQGKYKLGLFYVFGKTKAELQSVTCPAVGWKHAKTATSATFEVIQETK